MVTPANDCEKIRKRLVRQGASRLSNQELLVILLSPEDNPHTVPEITGTLLDAFDGNLRELFSATIHQLTQVEGIGFSNACKIKAAFELMKRISSFCEENYPAISSTDDIIPLVAPYMMHLKQEQFRVILLDSRNRVIHNCVISMGSLDSTVVKPREVFRPAVAHAAATIILVHNHPSGDPEPSKHDVLLTQKICMCGKVLDIEVLDHIIIGYSGFVSLKKRNLM